jgi:hypothetical protein
MVENVMSSGEAGPARLLERARARPRRRLRLPSHHQFTIAGSVNMAARIFSRAALPTTRRAAPRASRALGRRHMSSEGHAAPTSDTPWLVRAFLHDQCRLALTYIVRACVDRLGSYICPLGACRVGS